MALLIFVGLCLVGLAKEEQKVKPPTNAVVTITVTSAPPESKVAGPTAVPANLNLTSASWTDIKDDSYEMHAHFLAGLKRLEGKVDAQINELTAKRATLSNPPARNDWDLAMTEMLNASATVKLLGEELTTAGPEKWKLQKYLIGRAWLRTQEAYAKIQSSTAS